MAKMFNKRWWDIKGDELGEIDEKDFTFWHFLLSVLCMILSLGHAMLMVGQVVFMICWRLAAIFFVPLFWVIYGCYKDDKGGNSL